MPGYRRENQDGLFLFTDLYELTMAYGYWQSGMAEKEAVFNLFFRQHPFKGGFTITCGLEYAIDFMENFKLTASDVEYLRTLQGNDNKRLFEEGFLEYLQIMTFECDVDAIPEGTIVFPHEPLIRIKGPLIQAQILESALLNIINFQSLIATKAARICLAAQGEPVLEFGLRRAQGFDGAMVATRAAFLGGCSATSNVLAGKVFGIPVKGTHAHSWIMSFDEELEAFKAYAKALPNNCTFLVDTYDTLEGVKRAIEVGQWLRTQGHEMIGIRLDSGDLTYLSIEARKLLDDAGFPKAQIVATNDLDENIIQSIKEQGGRINVWGVGTKLITAYDQPALGGVYKLAAIRDRGTDWKYKVKVSEQSLKVSNPGIQQVRRYQRNGEHIADVIYDEQADLKAGCVMVDPLDMTRQKRIAADTDFEDLLKPVFRNGKKVYELPKITEIKERAQKSLQGFHSGVKRFVNPHQYPVGIEKSLYSLRTELILQARESVL